MQSSGFISELCRSVGFLSRFPVPARFFENHDGNMTQTVRAFPLAGLVITLPAAFVLATLLTFDADPLMSAFLAIAVSIAATGALHEDGFSDAADGLGGGRDREHALAIMKDSRIGNYGAIALILSIGIRVAALAALARILSPAGTAACLLAAAAISRALMVWHWSALDSARAEGVAARAGKPDDKARNLALLTGGLAAIAATLPFFYVGPLVLALTVPVAAAWAFTRFARRKLSGHTGDTIGATQQISEIALLCSLALAA